MSEKMKKFEKNKLIYKRLVRQISFEEKIWLLECDGDYDVYEKRLRFLEKKYALTA